MSVIAWEQGVCGLGSLDSDNEDKSDVEDEQESTEERWGERKGRSDLVNLNLCRTNRSLKQGVDTFITYARSSSIIYTSLSPLRFTTMKNLPTVMQKALFVNHSTHYT